MNHFTLSRLINTGGMGAVYEAHSALHGDAFYPVAIKVMNGNAHNRERYAELFCREVMTNLRISHNHPGLVTVFGQFENVDGSLCMVMELVEGCDLRTLLKECKTLPLDAILYIAASMLDALACVHDGGFIHRDLSPSNVLLSQDGHVKLSDLGLAKELLDGAADTSQFLGKPSYASPEALRRDTLDARSDMYSFAAMIFEMATGEPPFGRKLNFTEIANRLENWQPPSMAAVPSELHPLIGGLFHDDPGQRTPATAREALKMVRAMGGDDVTGRVFIAENVTPLYERERKRSEKQVSFPLGDINAPVVLQLRPDPLGDTDAPAREDTHSGTRDREPEVHPDELSISGLELSDAVEDNSSSDVEHTTIRRLPDKSQAPTRRRLLMALVIAAALVLGFVAHGAFDAATGERAYVVAEQHPGPEPVTHTVTFTERAREPAAPDRTLNAPVDMPARPFPELPVLSDRPPVLTTDASAKDKAPRAKPATDHSKPVCGVKGLCSASGQSTFRASPYPGSGDR